MRRCPSQTSITVSVPSNSSARTPPAHPLALASTLRRVPTIVTSWPRRQSIARCAPVLTASSLSSSTSRCSGSSVSRRVSRRRYPSAVAMASPDTSMDPPDQRSGRPVSSVMPRSARPAARTVFRTGHHHVMAVNLRGVTAVLLPGTGSDDDYVYRAFSAALHGAAAVAVAAPAQPDRLMEGYLAALDNAARQESIAAGGVSIRGGV